MVRNKRRGAGAATKLAYDDRELQIMNIAAALFEARGYERTSLKNIADEAHIEPASLYYYFSSKEDLYVKVMDRSLLTLAEMAREAIESTDDPWEKLERAAIVHCECMLAPTKIQVVFHPRFPLGISEHSLKELKRQRRDYEYIIRGIVDELALKEGIDKRLFLYSFLSSMNYAGLWYKKDGGMTPAEVAVGAMAILRACASDQG